MLEFTREQIDAVRKDPLLAREVESRLPDPSIVNKPASDLSDNEWDYLNDACYEALTSEAPVVESFDAEQSKGIYSVSIRGVPGAYFYSAIEFEDVGLFSTLEDARGDAEYEHGEFRVTDGDDEADIEEDEEAGAPTPEDNADALGAVESAASAEDIQLREQVVEFVKAFEKALPRPSGYIEGMARGYKKLPRLLDRVECFLRENGRMPDPDEAMELFETE